VLALRRAPTKGAPTKGAPKQREVAKARPTATQRPVATQREGAVRRSAVGRLGAVLAVVTVFALVTAVMFHVMLAQHQMELDRLNVRIAEAQRTYELRRLEATQLASPQRLIQEAQRLGLVSQAEPPKTLLVPGAPMPATDDGTTGDTIRDWSNTKRSLGTQP
jgi:cell division protein FtsL